MKCQCIPHEGENIQISTLGDITDSDVMFEDSECLSITKKMLCLELLSSQ